MTHCVENLMAPGQRTILHAFPSFAMGGAQARLVQVANALSKEAFFHRIAAMDNCYAAGERLSPEVAWEPLRVPNRQSGGLASRAFFRKVLQREKADVLLSYNWSAIEWAAANTPAVTPHVHVVDGFGQEEACRRLPRRNWTRRLLLGLQRTPTLVASRSLESIAVSEWWLPASRVAFIPNGVDGALIGSRYAQRAKAKGPQITVGTVAGLRPEKNIGRLIRAFAALHQDFPVRLVIVGDGSERQGLERLSRDLNVALRVEFTGYLKDPLSRLIEFDVFALSSDTEQLPIALLEAMACGMPVAATDVGDVGRILPDVAHGGLARPDDASFERALRHVLECRNEWEAWGRAGRERVQAEYSQQLMIDAWREIFLGNWRKVFDKPQRSRSCP
jgi:glycosyltransferase involved in cell wall biosynthesis